MQVLGGLRVLTPSKADSSCLTSRTKSGFGNQINLQEPHPTLRG